VARGTGETPVHAYHPRAGTPLYFLEEYRIHQSEGKLRKTFFCIGLHKPHTDFAQPRLGREKWIALMRLCDDPHDLYGKLNRLT